MAHRSVLVAFFSHSGNTQSIANQIHEIVGGNAFRILAAHHYPSDYGAVVEVARKELQNGDRPALADQVTNMGSYDVVFLGYPNWWSTMPMAVFSFLEAHDFSGKKIAPFCTHEGSSLGRSVEDIRALCPRSIVLDGLAVRGGSAGTAKEDVHAWLERIGLARKADSPSR
ncbi:MAG TPA: flavodoxin [Spirochaetia bacterium]|nr:flavodoxin [Spirochaetia bacterium]